MCTFRAFELNWNWYVRARTTASKATTTTTTMTMVTVTVAIHHEHTLTEAEREREREIIEHNSDMQTDYHSECQSNNKSHMRDSARQTFMCVCMWMCLFTHLWGDWLVDCAREKRYALYAPCSYWRIETPIHKRSISASTIITALQQQATGKNFAFRTKRFGETLQETNCAADVVCCLLLRNVVEFS